MKCPHAEVDCNVCDRSEAAAELRRLRAAIQAVLDIRERRCDVCGKPIAHRRDKHILVSKPNFWCADHKPEWREAPNVPDDSQPREVMILRAALSGSVAR